MKQQLKETVKFDFIRYANCWEDADVLLEGLNPKQGSKILSIGSAGDNSFSLLATNPELVVAVDINPVQLYLIELKKACFARLSHKETLCFLGFKSCTNRIETLGRLKMDLSKEGHTYWKQNIDLIQNGVISQGKFEKYFQVFSQKILPWIHDSNVIQQLFVPKSAEEQAHFFDTIWNTWRWKSLFKLFFSKYVMGKIGRDPAFLKEVNISVSAFILAKAKTQLSSPQAQDNYMLHYNLTASFGDLLPHYLRPENYDCIKSNLDKLHLVKGYAQEGIRKFGQFDAMNLSNIFEYMDSNLFASTAQELLDAIKPSGRIAYWNLMVPRQISALFPERIQYLADLSTRLNSIDKGFFYKEFIVEEFF